MNLRALKDAAADQALRTQLWLSTFIQKRETSDKDRGEIEQSSERQRSQGVEEKRNVSGIFLDAMQSMRGIYFRILERKLTDQFEEERISRDFTELMDAGEEADTKQVEGLWQKVRGRIDVVETVNQWLRNRVLPDSVKQHPEFSGIAKIYAVRYLRFLFAKRLNGESLKTGTDQESGE